MGEKEDKKAHPVAPGYENPLPSKADFYKSNPAVATRTPASKRIHSILWWKRSLATAPVTRDLRLFGPELVIYAQAVCYIGKANTNAFSEIVSFDYWRDQLPDGASENLVSMVDLQI